jgi:PPK2 family polyphosphate:nucleotide phosphotransferase
MAKRTDRTVAPDDGHLSARAARVRDLLTLPKGPVDLSDVDTRATHGLPDEAAVRKDPKTWSRADVARIGTLLADHQQRLFASAKATGDPRRVLLVLQAMDCGGKDGTINGVVGAMNPLGLRIKAFGPPTKEELAHHFLWRIRKALPDPGLVGVFNRSYYEDVLVARVRSLVPPRTWRARYDRINAFEEELVTRNVTIVKVMLHISYEEQRQRLLARLLDPTKRWKFNRGDLDDRALWPAYQAAYADALARCNTDDARWHVVPADRKWYRNWAVANVLLAALEGMRLTYPDVDLDVAELRMRLESEDGAGPSRETKGELRMNGSLTPALDARASFTAA